MAVVQTNDFQIVNMGATLELVPRQYRLITNMDLFTAYYGETTIARVERVDEVVTDFPARRRQGERNYVGTERLRSKTSTFRSSHWIVRSQRQTYRTSAILHR
ncbi:hypothetical protein SP41_15 [Salmonella phage 41]|nr:hypothetical protein SP41_15 [Salmonella phage 41]